jgi:hypothetical protein
MGVQSDKTCNMVAPPAITLFVHLTAGTITRHHVALETTIRKQPNTVRRIMSFHYCSLVISLQSWKKIVELKPRVMGLSNWQIHAASPALKHTRHLSFLHSWHLVAKIFPHRPRVPCPIRPAAQEIWRNHLPGQGQTLPRSQFGNSGSEHGPMGFLLGKRLASPSWHNFTRVSSSLDGGNMDEPHHQK